MVTETRVRGVLRTPSGSLLLIKRTRPSTTAYWVFPGGGVEEEDASFEDALRREVKEELAGTATVKKLVYVLERQKSPDVTERELYYLADVDRWSEDDRSGPEFAVENAAAGRYEYDEVPLTPAELNARDIKPDAVREFLVEHCDNLASLPDLR